MVFLARRMADIIYYKPSAIPMAVKQWWSDFDKEPATAVGKLTNMMIEVPFLFIQQSFFLQVFSSCAVLFQLVFFQLGFFLIQWTVLSLP